MKVVMHHYPLTKKPCLGDFGVVEGFTISATQVNPSTTTLKVFRWFYKWNKLHIMSLCVRITTRIAAMLHHLSIFNFLLHLDYFRPPLFSRVFCLYHSVFPLLLVRTHPTDRLAVYVYFDLTHRYECCTAKVAPLSGKYQN